MTFLFLAISLISHSWAQEKPDPAWISSQDRHVQGGDVLYIGSSEQSSREQAEFMALGSALRKMVFECSGIPKNAKVWRQFVRNIGDRFRASVEVGVALAECEELKTASDERRSSLINAKLDEDQRRYAEKMGWTSVETPKWARTGTRKTGTTLSVVCFGDGPDLSTARATAIDGCKNSALGFISDDGTIKTLGASAPNGGSSVHHEIRSERHFKGLSCLPKHEASQVGDSLTYLWLACDFDLTKVLLTTSAPEVQAPPSKGMIQNRSEAESSQDTSFALSEGRHITSDTKTLTIATTPMCVDLLIQGKVTRAVKCNENPMSVVIYPTDKEIVIRPDKGYLPKTLKLSQEKTEDDSIQVFLDPAH